MRSYHKRKKWWRVFLALLLVSKLLWIVGASAFVYTVSNPVHCQKHTYLSREGCCCASSRAVKWGGSLSHRRAASSIWCPRLGCFILPERFAVITVYSWNTLRLNYFRTHLKHLLHCVIVCLLTFDYVLFLGVFACTVTSFHHLRAPKNQAPPAKSVSTLW